ncbi:MAG: DUF4412 domain-containing protein [Saprospiraceae bacterium]|nr:DUF4412 domain-containing protein [Saprospiraceae bacterium]
MKSKIHCFNKLSLLLIIFLSCSGLIFSQSFEGTIEMLQVTPSGIEYNMKWYIKKGKLSYELSFESARGHVEMRFVPQKSSNSILMITGDSKIEIPSSEISTPDGFSMEGAKLLNNGKVKNSDFKKVYNWQISTEDIVSNIDVTHDVDINFSEYKEFFKSDYGICALVESGEHGFPLNSTTLDKDGNLLTKTTLKKVTRKEISDSYFQ